MTLWEEHLGQVRREFQKPESQECMDLVQDLAQENWDVYTGEEIVELPHGHLLPYPLQARTTPLIYLMIIIQCV